MLCRQCLWGHLSNLARHPLNGTTGKPVAHPPSSQLAPACTVHALMMATGLLAAQLHPKGDLTGAWRVHGKGAQGFLARSSLQCWREHGNTSYKHIKTRTQKQKQIFFWGVLRKAAVAIGHFFQIHFSICFWAVSHTRKNYSKASVNALWTVSPLRLDFASSVWADRSHTTNKKDQLILSDGYSLSSSLAFSMHGKEMPFSEGTKQLKGTWHFISLGKLENNQHCIYICGVSRFFCLDLHLISRRQI